MFFIRLSIMSPYPITTVILAGGRGLRIGGDKGLKLLQGKPLISWVLSGVQQHSVEVLLNVNGAPASYALFACRVIADEMAEWPGPLAGLHAGLLSAKAEYVLTVPCDTPFLPKDLITRLFLQLQSGGNIEAVVAVSASYRQPTIALYRKNVLPKLLAFLATGGRKVNDWLNTLQLSEVVFDNAACFDNINSAEDLMQAEQMLNNNSCKNNMDAQKIIGFAGFSGSGKTTLLEQVIPLLKAQGLRIAVIKHAHHKFDIDIPGKDSFRHREAGAGEVLVVSGFRWALMHELSAEVEPSLEDLCKRLSPCDLVLVEGYKFSNIPKIEIHRSDTGHPHLYQDDANFIALATDVRSDIKLPQLDINNPQQVADFILKYFSLDK